MPFQKGNKLAGSRKARPVGLVRCHNVGRSAEVSHQRI